MPVFPLGLNKGLTLPDQQEGVWKQLRKRRPVNDGVFPLAVLNDVVGEIQQVQAVRRISCWKGGGIQSVINDL